jgi:NADP-dependent 3-hydroxy acid dehydrogenase YdfG
MPAISLDGKTAIVTGASSGFGKVIAQALRDAGVKVAVGVRRVELLEGDFAHRLDVTTRTAAVSSSRRRSRRSAAWTSWSTTPAARSAATRSGSRARTTRSG